MENSIEQPKILSYVEEPTVSAVVNNNEVSIIMFFIASIIINVIIVIVLVNSLRKSMDKFENPNVIMWNSNGVKRIHDVETRDYYDEYESNIHGSATPMDNDTLLQTPANFEYTSTKNVANTNSNIKKHPSEDSLWEHLHVGY